MGVDEARTPVLQSVRRYLQRVSDQRGSLEDTAALHWFVQSDLQRLIEVSRPSGWVYLGVFALGALYGCVQTMGWVFYLAWGR